MRKIFQARSPIWHILIYSLGFGFLSIVTAVQNDSEAIKSLRPVALTVSILMIVVVLVYVVQLATHNKNNPNDRIRYWGFFPVELDEQDEVFKHFTQKAMRRVYIYYAVLLPLLAILYAFLLPAHYVVVAALGVLLVGHYVLYWMSVWPLWHAEEENEGHFSGE